MTIEKSDINKSLPATATGFAELNNFIRKYWLKIGLTGLLFGIVGYGFSYLTPETFRSTATILPESASSSGLGSFSGLARLTGIGKNESGGSIPTDLYPSILGTTLFGMYLLQQPVIDQDNHRYKTLKEYLHNNSKSSSADASVSTSSPKVSESTKIISLSKLEEQYVKKALRLVGSSFDQKSGTITIESTTSDPYVSAQLVEITSQYLIQYITDYRTEKTSREVTFLGDRATELKKRQQGAEYALQNYKDRNRNPFLNVARIEEQRLQSDYVLASSLYSDIVRKWEEAKIKVKEQQPVIKVLSPPQIPLKRFKPIRRNTAATFAVVGALIFVVYSALFVEKYLRRLYS